MFAFFSAVGTSLFTSSLRILPVTFPPSLSISSSLSLSYPSLRSLSSSSGSSLLMPAICASLSSTLPPVDLGLPVAILSASLALISAFSSFRSICFSPPPRPPPPPPPRLRPLFLLLLFLFSAGLDVSLFLLDLKSPDRLLSLLLVLALSLLLLLFLLRDCEDRLLRLLAGLLLLALAGYGMGLLSWFCLLISALLRSSSLLFLSALDTRLTGAGGGVAFLEGFSVFLTPSRSLTLFFGGCESVLVLVGLPDSKGLCCSLSICSSCSRLASFFSNFLLFSRSRSFFLFRFFFPFFLSPSLSDKLGVPSSSDSFLIVTLIFLNTAGLPDPSLEWPRVRGGATLFLAEEDDLGLSPKPGGGGGAIRLFLARPRPSAWSRDPDPALPSGRPCLGP